MEQVAAHVPAGFRVHGALASTATLLVELVHCPRATVPDAVVASAGYLQIFVRVSPLNETWKETGSASYYVLELAVTDAALQGTAADQGARAAIGSLERQSRPGADGARVEAWTFRAANYSLETEFVHLGGAGGGERTRIHLWHGAETGLRRIDDLKDYRHDQALMEGGALRFHGTPPLGDLFLPSGVVEWAGRPYHQSTDIWEAHQILYQGEKP